MYRMSFGSEVFVRWTYLAALLLLEDDCGQVETLDVKDGDPRQSFSHVQECLWNSLSLIESAD